MGIPIDSGMIQRKETAMKRIHMAMLLQAGLLLACLCCALPVWAVTLQQVVSRENTEFNLTTPAMGVGRDGKVYLCNWNQNTGHSYILRINANGTQKGGSVVSTEAAVGVAANANGTIATAHGHFAHCVNVYDANFSLLGSVNSFLVSDAVGWDAPGDVQVGASGDFYGLDQHNNRIIRISPQGQTVCMYPYAAQTYAIMNFRVCEATNTIYLYTGYQSYIAAMASNQFDGNGNMVQKWTVPGMSWASFDVDDSGTLYTLNSYETIIRKWDTNGNASGTVTLTNANPGGVLGIRSGQAFIRYGLNTELFRVFDLATGAWVRTVTPDIDVLTATFSSETWTAGATMPFTITFTSNRPNTPAWHVWARPCDTVAYRDLGYSGGQITIPADCSGLFDIKVTPEQAGWQTGAVAEYWVHDIVEIRKSGAPGTISVYTTGNRLHFNPGEQIIFTASLRQPGTFSVPVTINLTDAGSNVIASGSVTLTNTAPSQQFFVPSAITAGLRPGSYTLNATSASYTCVPQPLVLGTGLQKPPFRFILYGDYGMNYVNGTLSQQRDLVAMNAIQMKKLGVNMVVDRLGCGPSQYTTWANADDGIGMINTLTARLSGDPAATDPAKANPETPLQQTLASFSAGNTESMSILMGNDIGLPIGTVPNQDTRTAAQFQADITSLTNLLLPYPAYRGWDWASNWWDTGGDGALNPTEDAQYQAAVTNAKNTGAWDPIIDTVANRRLNRASDAWATLSSTPVIQSNPQLVRATGSPFRNVDSYPPFAFSNVDESDLQAQWEQYMLPYHTAWNVDYYKRPGKKAWFHPEIWNDAGTGEQILQSTFMGLMRLPDGVGASTNAGGASPFLGWGLDVIHPEDTRSAEGGTTSVFRTMSNTILQPFGPWLTTLAKNDRVALVVSERQVKVDDWPCNMPRYYGRLYEAYLTLLHAHYPATIVFTTDLTSTSLNGFKAVLLVDQWVQLDPGLQTTLTNAKNAGAAIFYDGTCRDSLFTGLGFTPLGISFNKFETLPSEASNDYNWISFLNFIRQDESAVTTALASVTPPATIGIDEVFTSESVEEQGRYVFVMNNITPTGIDPANMWKVTNYCTSRVPIQTTVTLPNVTGKTVYDIFAKASLGTPSGGNVTTDLRTLPLRIYALLPAAIDHVKLTGPNTAVTCGQPFNWQVQVCDATNTAIAASIPVHVQLLAADGVTVLRECYTGVPSAGATGTFILPVNLVGGAPILKATELFTGVSTQQTLTTTAAGQGTLPLQGQQGATLNTPVPATLVTNGNTPDATVGPVQNAYGPHIRDIAISADSTQLLCTTMNWDHNLYAVNLSNGATNWRQRAGQYFTFCPQTAGSGFAVQGFNFGTAEGYGLYLISSTGTLTRCFNSYGLARRDTSWLLTTPVENDPSNNFTAAPDGSWVATAGNLGLAVWNAGGTLLWKQDWADRHLGRVTAVSASTLLVCEGMTVTAYSATTGAQNWRVVLATTPGKVIKVAVTSDSTKCVLLTDNQGGRVFILNSADGSTAAMLTTGGQDLGITSTASLIAVACANQVKVYSLANGMQWIFNADSAVRFPRFSTDNTKLVCTSDLGSAYVLDTSGNKLFERDMGACCAAAWLPNGDLVLASWEGAVYRLTASTYAQQWGVLLTPSETDMRTKLMNADGAPVTRITTWSNALDTNYPLTPNLVGANSSILSYLEDSNVGAAFASDPTATLLDGSATPPANPWVAWETIYAQAMFGIATQTHVQLDTYFTQLQINAITLAEDPAHPESWVREATVDYWDVPSQSWKTGPTIFADTATHTHVLSTPLQTPRIKISLPPMSPSNLRLGEIVLHGTALGCSHPDVVAGRNTCVLFDESQYPLDHLMGAYTFQYSGAYSGGLCLVKNDTNTVAPWCPTTPSGFLVKDWNMKIVQTPQNPDEFRYLQFAWKALDAGVTGIAIDIGEMGADYVSCYCGTYCGESYIGPALRTQVSPTVPGSWTLATVDLWPLFQSLGGKVKYITFCSAGGTGKAAFDAIKLFKTDPRGPVYTPPTVSSFSTNYASYTATYAAPANVVMTAQASDPNSGGSITKVEFYNGAALLNTTTSSPYAYTWVTSTAGSFALTARAYDNYGLQTNSGVVNITISNGQVAPPFFSPPAGAFATAQSVTIGTNTIGATIRYTTDGTTPTSSVGTIYSSAINVSANTTLKAIAYKSGMPDSPVSTGVFNIQCAAPTFSVAPGFYSTAQTVTISTATSGATIRYTLDGTTPSATVGTLYSSAVTLSSSIQLKAIAYKSGMTDSPVTSGAYQIPTTCPPQNGLAAWYSGQLVPPGTTTMSNWVDGSGNQFTATGAASYAASVSGINNMPAVYFDGTQTMLTANMNTAFNGSTGGMLFVLYQPNASGDFAYISQMNGGTLDTHDRFSGSQAYLNAFLNSTGGRTNAYPGNIPSDNRPVLLEVKSSPSGYQTWVSGTAGSGTPPAQQYWQAPTTFTLGGGGSNCPKFTGWVAEILVYNTADDAIRQQVETYINNRYGVSNTTCATPSFNPPAGTYTTSQTVTISTATSGATIRYTTDGTTPSETNGTVGTSVTLNGNCVLQAIAYKTGLADSLIASANYAIPTPPPSTGLVAWYSGMTIPTGTTTMTAWSDATSNHLDATGAAAYASSISALNNRPGVYFNGSQTMLTANMNSAFGANTQGMLFVLYVPNVSGDFAYISQNNGGTMDTHDRFSNSQAYLNAFINSTGFRTNAYPGNIPSDNRPVLLEVSSSSSGYQTWVSGTPGSGTPPTQQYWQTPTTFTLGGGAPVAPNFNGWLAEVLVYNTASDTIRQGVENYVRGLYGCAAPSFSPPPGFCTSAQTVTISTATSGATIRYTTDGSTPSETNGTIYNTPISITGTTTLKAIAYQSGMLSSMVTSGVYTFNQCETPTFSVTPGFYSSAQTVTISTATTGATIRYTLDGTTPTETVGTVGTTVTLTSSVLLQAIAYKSGMLDSRVATGAYQIPSVLPPQNGLAAWYSGQLVSPGTSSMTSWLDGSGNQFSASGAASYAANVSGMNNMPAVYFDGTQTMLTANMSSAFSSSTGGMLFVLYQPNVSGDFAYISQMNGGTLDTHDRFVGSQAYLNAFLNSSGGRTNAYPGNIPSDNRPVLLEVKSSPSGYQTWVSGTAGSGTPPAQQYWQAPTTFTLGGGGSNSPKFTGWVAEVLVYNTADDTVRQQVEAYINNRYGVSNTTCATPSFNPPAGTYTTTQTVTISTATSGATVRYTTDGTTPTETVGTVYSSTVTLNGNCVLKAIAYKSGLADSTVASAYYAIPTPPPSTGLVAWYSGMTIPTGTSTMAAWSDATSNHLDASGAASYAASVSALNNRPAVYFNGSQTMTTANMNSTFGASTQGMVFVLYVPNVSGDFAYLSQNNAGTTDTHDRFSSGQAYLNAFMNSTGLRTNAYPGNIPTDNRPVLLEVSSSASGYQAWVTGTPGTGTPPAQQYWQTPTTFTLGGGAAVAPNFTGWLAEVLVYNSASDTIRQGVENYVKGLYGCAAPVFSPTPGTYSSAQTVTITCATGGATIRYTTDGSTPSETNGTIYSTPINIAATTTLKAIAYQNGMLSSTVTSGVYTITP